MGLLDRIAVDIWPAEQNDLHMFQGLALPTSTQTDVAYWAAKEFTSALRKRVRSAGFMQSMMQQRICSSIASGIATAGAEIVNEEPSYACDEAESNIRLEVCRKHEKELRNLHLQEQRLSRRRERETAELKELQTIRKANEEEALRAGAKQAVLSQHRGEASTMIDGLGFVFSMQRFDTYMKRLTPAQKAKLLQEAIAEAGEEPKTQEAAA